MRKSHGRRELKTIIGLESIDPPLKQSVLTIGNFDGVHRGHQQLLAQAGLFAANTGGPVVVLTFEPHPLTVVAPAKAPARLTTLDEKLLYLSNAGADITAVARSEPSLLGLEAEEFVEEILVRLFHPTHIVEGPSFQFGRGRQGNAELLRHMAGDIGCEVHTLEPVNVQIDQGETLMVSSSLIRELVTQGKVRRAGLCLGHPYVLEGRVVEGDRRGHTIGFPTANLEVADKLIPGESVYSGVAVVEDQTFAAAISVGQTPTFGGSERKIEAHILDFDGDLYGQSLRLEFGRRIRLQRTFESADNLVEQLRRDVEIVRSESGAIPHGDAKNEAEGS